MLLLRSGLDWPVNFARELACKLLMIPTQITRDSNYYSVGCLACIILLLSGSSQYYSYMANLSSDNSAYGQEQGLEVDDGRVNLQLGQEQSVDDEGSEVSSHVDTPSATTPREDDTSEDKQPPPPEQAQPPPPEQAQPDSDTSSTPREDDTSEDKQPPPPEQAQPPPPEQAQPPPPEQAQ